MNRDLCSALKKEMDRRGLTQTVVGRALNRSSATISQYLSGTYKGNITALEKRIKSFLESSETRSLFHQDDLPFRLTSVAKRVMGIARLCQVDGVIGLVVGDSGVGKTRAVREYQEQHPEAIVIDAFHHYRTKDVMSDLHKAVNLSGEGTVQKMFRDVVERLKNSERLVVIDEAEHVNLATLDLLRRLNDFAGVGVLYVGLPRFREDVSSKSGDYEYIKSRIVVPATLKRLTLSDTESLVETRIPSANGLCKVFHQCSAGNGRRLRNLLNNAVRVAGHNGGKVTAEIVEAVQKELTV
ncbi:MAG: AAA family ATPase [Ignavibacteriae bacterium]|nr:AAA family ATPase [Candidatus Andersenbacteria bacterium]MCB0713417.1 AAA family ATPase [Ignavibacteriota bacterium]MCB9216119.1 AAA family ATPase [Ignavibacteria bacterium]